MKIQTKRVAEAYAGWKLIVSKYHHSDVRKSVWQIVNSFGGLFLCWLLMYFSLNVGYWLTLLLSLPAAGFLVRIFIIQHDCGHASFFKNRSANDTVGIVCSLFTTVPYKYWRKGHAVHHSTHAELEERGTGDIWTLTVDEYINASRWKKFCYRVFRNPIFLFGIAPTINFLIMGRVPLSDDTGWKNGEKASVWWTNAAMAGWIAAASALIGFGNVMLIYLPTVILASSAGVWMFYVQHQFERMYWEHTPQWDYTLAAMAGSSYYKMPKVLQWFTGNIGFHHIHHLSPRIPNYLLETCHNENPMMQQVVELTLKSSLQTAWLALWDERQRRLVTFREALQPSMLQVVREPKS